MKSLKASVKTYIIVIGTYEPVAAGSRTLPWTTGCLRKFKSVVNF